MLNLLLLRNFKYSCQLALHYAYHQVKNSQNIFLMFSFKRFMFELKCEIKSIEQHVIGKNGKKIFVKNVKLLLFTTFLHVYFFLYFSQFLFLKKTTVKIK
jgi:hypothetical protein